MTSICIFGSVARNEQDVLSDKDVLILYDGSEECNQLMFNWRTMGWSVANYTPNRLQLMADAGSLFLQHLKQEGIITKDSGDVLSEILRSYEPNVDYSHQIMKSANALKLLECVPISHELDYWSADLLHVLIRNIGLLRLANEGIYEFSFIRIAHKLIDLNILNIDDFCVFEELRTAKAYYRTGYLPNTTCNITVENSLRIVEKICGISIERSNSLDFSVPDLNQPYFNLRAMEKILVAYNGLPTLNDPLSAHEARLWRCIRDPRTYSWEVKTKQSDLWKLLLNSVKKKPYIVEKAGENWYLQI